MLEVFDKLINHLRELGINEKEIISISDSNFKYYVDDRKKYQKYIAQGTIIEMPAGTKADKGILAFLLKHDNAVCITQDLYREYYEFLPHDKWIVERRICVLIIKDELYLIPMRDSITKEIIQGPLAEKEKKSTVEQAKDKNENENRTTIDVLNDIEGSDENLKWDIYSE